MLLPLRKINMQITLENDIQIGTERDLIHQVFDVQYQFKKRYNYLIFLNEDKEKVVLKFSERELLMTRFSQPKSVMRFIKGEDTLTFLPTPLGSQPLTIVTDFYLYQAADQELRLQYKLKPLGSDEALGRYKMKLVWN